MEKRQPVVSPCLNYVANTSLDNNHLNIYNSRNGQLFRSYNLVDALREFIKVRKRAKIEISITQIEWEERTSYGPACSKIAIVVNNFSFLVVFDIRRPETYAPIFIVIPPSEGIERCQWIPPPEIGEEENRQNPSEYINSKQIAIFTKSYAHVRIYSLDCSHMLFSMRYPVFPEIIIRPNKGNRFWSLIVNTVEYNAPPMLLHFFNEGSISALVHRIRLPHKIVTTPHISWSPTGTWMQISSDTESLFGFHLLAFDFFGPSTDNDSTKVGEIGSVINMKYFDSGMINEKESIQLSPGKFYSNWLTPADGSEYLFICGIEQRQIFVQVVSFDLMRVVYRDIIEIPENVQGWKQEPAGLSFTNIQIPRNYKLEMTDVFTDGTNIFITLNETYVLHYSFDILLHEKSKVRFTTLISVLDTVNRIIPTKNNEAIIVTRTHAILYDMNKLKARVSFAGRDGIQSINFGHDETMVLFNNRRMSPNWELIPNRELIDETKQPPSRVRLSLLDENMLNMDEVTDTFQGIKRARQEHAR